MHIEDQPAPTPNNRPAIWDLVIADMKARDKLGRERYGTPLQAFNGRDALVDAYQEALDLSVYLRQAIAEREEAKANHVQHCLWARNSHDPCPHMRTEQQRPWVGLTDDELWAWWTSNNGLEDCDMRKFDDFQKVVAAVTEKLCAKNEVKP